MSQQRYGIVKYDVYVLAFYFLPYVKCVNIIGIYGVQREVEFCFRFSLILC